MLLSENDLCQIGSNNGSMKRPSTNLWLECEEPMKEQQQYQQILNLFKEFDQIGSIKKTDMSQINEEEVNATLPE